MAGAGLDDDIYSFLNEWYKDRGRSVVATQDFVDRLKRFFPSKVGKSGKGYYRFHGQVPSLLKLRPVSMAVKLYVRDAEKSYRFIENEAELAQPPLSQVAQQDELAEYLQIKGEA